MKILVMRPERLGKDLVNNLNKIGIKSWHFSFFDFDISTSSMNLSNKCNELYQSNIIVLFSKRSIYYTNLYLKHNNLKWPDNVKYFTIGQSTALFLYKYVKKKYFSLKKKKIVRIY
ncbi:uroporphyrinogen-III synthase [Buchnera aphidicola (Diuraphis noxia)]|uniref:Uroporphyrinogen-III synthase n=1 Tax=Buchnera aphidicola subsp. Diuraphis noxia TaxID=118101 RepID=A0A1B2H968_BUCDN|nr:uroporphyrinogen-III synthase [Buchnera aphidicola]ANZ22764.1 uroporphyrinogen-III synthase [Buchnera aphidicola (Diuraphis noxia)]